MDILLDKAGDLLLSKTGDIVLNDSVAQKIRIRLLWFEGEWKWDRNEGMPYFDQLFVKNPDLDYFESVVRSRIFEVEEVTDVKNVEVSFDRKARNAVIRFVAQTDQETIKDEVVIKCRITE